jgi:citrate lyase subunit beta/citryl-CoA lyase
MILLRSMLFTPGNNMRMIASAGGRGADAVIFDLEDSVPMADKETARLFVRDAVADLAKRGGAVYVRINALGTGLGSDDLGWVVRPGLTGIMVPKSETAADVEAVSDELAALEKEHRLEERSVRIVPLLESARGVLGAFDIASSSPRVAAVAFGGVDFSRDMAVTLTSRGAELAYPRAHIAMAARAASVLAVDTPCLAVKDRSQLRADAETARQFGFKGKLLIHPLQVATVNEVFSPAESDVTYARKIVESFDEARAQGLGAISLDGKMVDVANYRQAQDLLASAEAIARRREG